MKYCFLYVLFPFFASASLFAQTEPPEYASVLSKYIQIPSEQYKEKKAGLFLLEECRKKGLVTEILTPEDTAFNFIASIYPLTDNKPNIIFLNHIDVVSPGDTTRWKYPAYSGKISDGVIWGRGAIDDKGMAVAQLFAMAKFRQQCEKQELPFNVSMLCVAGEETDGFTGAQQVTERFMDKLNPYLVLGEGGSGVRGLIRSDPQKIVYGVSTAEKTKLILHLEMHLPSSGHGSVPPKEYAMKEMIFALEKLLKKKPEVQYKSISVRALKLLGKHEKGIKGFVQRNFTFIFFKPLVKKQIEKDPVLLSFFANTITFTDLITPESSDNQISQTVKATFDCRLLPGTNTDRFVRSVNRWVKDPRVDVQVIYEVRSAPRTDDPELFKVVSNSLTDISPGSVVVPMIFPATTDNNFFRELDIPVFGIFPACFTEAEISSIHNLDEHIHIERLEQSINTYVRFLENMQDFKRKPPLKVPLFH